MFERFTEPARRVVVHALEVSQELGHGEVGTEHLLVGLAGAETDGSREVLAAAGANASSLRDALIAASGRGTPGEGGQIPFTADAKRVMERAVSIVTGLGRETITSEDLLAGLLDAEPPSALRLLRSVDVDVELLAEELRKRLRRAL